MESGSSMHEQDLGAMDFRRITIPIIMGGLVIVNQTALAAIATAPAKHSRRRIISLLRYFGVENFGKNLERRMHTTEVEIMIHVFDPDGDQFFKCQGCIVPQEGSSTCKAL